MSAPTCARPRAWHGVPESALAQPVPQRTARSPALQARPGPAFHSPSRTTGEPTPPCGMVMSLSHSCTHSHAFHGPRGARVFMFTFRADRLHPHPHGRTHGLRLEPQGAMRHALQSMKPHAPSLTPAGRWHVQEGRRAHWRRQTPPSPSSAGSLVFATSAMSCTTDASLLALGWCACFTESLQHDARHAASIRSRPKQCRTSTVASNQPTKRSTTRRCHRLARWCLPRVQ